MALSLKQKKNMLKLGIVISVFFIITGFTIMKFLATYVVPAYVELTSIKSALFVHYNAENIMKHVVGELIYRTSKLFLPFLKKKN